MTQHDIVFLALVVGLPILVSVQLFRKEPKGRWFIFTYLLAVIGSSLGFLLASLVLALLGVGGLGMFDGLIEFAISLPVALIVGLIIRFRRARQSPSAPS